MYLCGCNEFSFFLFSFFFFLFFFFFFFNLISLFFIKNIAAYLAREKKKISGALELTHNQTPPE